MTSTFHTIQEIAAALVSAETILVASHIRPDGDALGSVLAFALYLEQSGKSVVTWNQDGVPEKFRYLPGWERIVTPPTEPRHFDAVVALDSSAKDRLGSCLEAIAGDPVWVNIDHHVSNTHYGDHNLVDPSAPATGQILIGYFDDLGIPLTQPMAENLFAAISTDTGSFQYRGTDARTFSAAARLVEAGVDVASLSLQMYDCLPRRRFNLLRHALNSARFLCGGRLATFALSLAEARSLAVRPEDSEGIIDHLRAVDSVVVAVFYEELEGGIVRVSARSKDPAVDVSALCGLYGGGGHRLASGARIQGTLGEVMEKFNGCLCNAIEQAN